MADEVRIAKGRLLPDQATVRRLARAIGKELRTDPAAMAEFQRNPRRFLGDRGLSIDIQRELLLSVGVPEARLRKVCGVTKVCNVSKINCAFTCIFGGTIILLPPDLTKKVKLS